MKCHCLDGELAPDPEGDFEVSVRREAYHAGGHMVVTVSGPWVCDECGCAEVYERVTVLETDGVVRKLREIESGCEYAR